MSGLPREILKWIQSLDLSHPVRNTRRDFSNGYLVAEIFSWYFPEEIEMHSYDNGKSLPSRQGNWSQLQRFFQRHEFDIPKEVIDGTIHCKPNAAALLMERIYSLLTNRNNYACVDPIPAQNIINIHLEHRKQERIEDPRRFRIRPTLGQLCPRRMPPSIVNNDEGSQLQRNHRDITGKTAEEDTTTGPFTEIGVFI
ncbi:PREDICTED: spermatogenesis-associated protein 4-like [Acropora digitifera]|uniref:spermatogenesis-associated protein 4-like n=1 Tax=Acropora digitifera TaxID=70779 RepID=UPI00077AB994|nr:PREDICTED: spermatogenesis-associated protein 4-like [Acropora digitifera]